MQLVTELSLPALDMEGPAFSADPFPHFAAARAQHPWLATSHFGYVITEYEAMKDLMVDERMHTPQEALVDFMDARDTHWGRFQVESLMALSGADHARIRGVLAPAFTPRAANRNRDLMRATISRVLDAWVSKGRFDFAQFAADFPIQVLCSLLGADTGPVPALRSSMETISLSFSMQRDLLPALEQAVVTMEQYVDGLVAERDARGPSDKPDLLDDLIAVRDSGGLDAGELQNLLIFLFVAGYDTSKNSLSLTMYQLLSRQQMYERCAEDLAYCQLVVEESLRYRVASAIYRTTSQEVDYRGVLFPKGVMLFMPAIIATRISGAVANPHDFDPERRDENRHIAFGRGPHMCLGQYIARAQVAEGLHQITQRIKNPQLAGEIGESRPFAGGWHFSSLPIAFTPPSAPEPEPEPEPEPTN